MAKQPSKYGFAKIMNSFKFVKFSITAVLNLRTFVIPIKINCLNAVVQVHFIQIVLESQATVKCICSSGVVNCKVFEIPQWSHWNACTK